jgi:hypothetical protein
VYWLTAGADESNLEVTGIFLRRCDPFATRIRTVIRPPWRVRFASELAHGRESAAGGSVPTPVPSGQCCTLRLSPITDYLTATKSGGRLCLTPIARQSLEIESAIQSGW